MTMVMAAATGTSIWRITIGSAIMLVILAILPQLVEPYQTVLLTYGLIMAIAALGFNLLLGYTGLLSFGHSAYFGAGAYLVAFIMRDFGVHSMELCIHLCLLLLCSCAVCRLYDRHMGDRALTVRHGAAGDP